MIIILMIMVMMIIFRLGREDLQQELVCSMTMIMMMIIMMMFMMMMFRLGQEDILYIGSWSGQ